MSSYIPLIIGWTVYLGLHSVFAAEGVKRRIPLGEQAYRLIYSTMSTIGLIVLIGLMAVSKSVYFYEQTFVTKYLGLGLGVWGVMLMVAAFREISLKSFLGVHPAENKGLVTTGIHAKVRHPIYSGGLLILLGMLISVPSNIVLVSIACICAYLPIGIHFEEKKLLKDFGDDYREYRKQVKAIIPGVM
ncbi:NnrU family protein [Marinoscillum sp. MHG1-6]|uniref:NnrU family protein n=1 Tax=Marinoscillum sp. MHG1-6 TaxID=2959627 RepID=UPI0021574303|nr:isoprenylcysteine carboxylmethyltransferase family protein [Marinoscillum sp. MHG1-6]